MQYCTEQNHVFLFKALGTTWNCQSRNCSLIIIHLFLQICCSIYSLCLVKTQRDAAPGLRVHTFACCSFFFFYHASHTSPGTASCFFPPFLILFRFFCLFVFVFFLFLVLHANLSVVISFFQLMSGLLAASWLKWSGVVCCFQALIVSLS